MNQNRRLSPEQMEQKLQELRQDKNTPWLTDLSKYFLKTYEMTTDLYTGHSHAELRFLSLWFYLFIFFFFG